MAWNNDKFIDFMKGIIPSSNAENEYDVNDIRGSLTTMLQSQNITFNEALEHMWKSFLDFIQQEGLNSNSLPNGTLPITQNLFNKTENVTSLFEFINNKIDLNDTFFTNLLNNYGQNNIDLSNINGLNNNNYFWNESVSYLISYVMRNLTRAGIEYDNGLTISWNNSGKNYNTNIKNILQSNAFKDQVNYVQPINNISNVSYKNTRGEDLIQADTKEENLQFTNEANVNNNLRLGMPEYERRVKVEDLNRNFWVISQCVAGISAYLFEDNSPISTAFNKILNELVQLWENLLYLWAIFAISIQNDKEYTDVHTEVVPLSISDLYNFRKYDNFDLYPSKSITPSDLNSLKIKILQNIKYLEDMYPESNLCIIPFLRVGNYEHNYYTEEWYPGVALFNRNKEQNLQWDFKYFNPIYAPQMINYNGTNYGIRFKLNGNIPKFSSSGSSQGSVVISDNIWTVTRAKAGEVKALYPYSKVNSYEEWDNDNYYAALRCIPSNFSASYVNHEVVFGGGKISIIDAIGESIKKWASTIDSENERYTQVQEFKQMDILYGEYTFGEDFNESEYPIGNEGINTTQTVRTIADIAPFGYYLGELISGMGTSLKKYPELQVYNVYGRPLINNMTIFELSENELKGDHEFFSSLQTKDQKDLQEWINRDSGTIVNEKLNFYLFTLTHQYNLTDGDTNYINNYIDYNEDNSTYTTYLPEDNDPPGLTIDSPILKFNRYSDTNGVFEDTTLGTVLHSTDNSIRYKGRSGKILSSAQLWNPFGQKFLKMPQYFNYDRINLNPTQDPNPTLYDSDNNQIHYRDCKKMNTFVPIYKFKKNGKYSLIDDESIIKAYFVAPTITSTSLNLFDYTREIKEQNWAIKQWSATMNYNCVFSEDQARKENGNLSFYKKGFNPFNIKLTTSYSPTAYINTAQITFSLLKNNCTYYYDINSDDLYQTGFYTLGYDLNNMTKESIQSDFNLLLDFATRVNDVTSFPSLADDNILRARYSLYAQIRNQGVSVNFLTLFSHSSIQLYSSYTSTISAMRIFPNGSHILTRVTTSSTDGYNKRNNSTQIKYFSPNFDIEEWLPQFEKVYTDGKLDVDASWSAFVPQWNSNIHTLYTIQSVGSCIDKNGIIDPFKQNITTLNFSKYFNNGRKDP